MYKNWDISNPLASIFSFTINEENNYRNILNENDNKDIPKIKEADKFYSNYNNNSIFKNSDIENLNINNNFNKNLDNNSYYYWFMNHSNSCRYVLYLFFI